MSKNNESDVTQPDKAQADNSNTAKTKPYKIKVKRSKYADFMQAYKIRTPKYKFYLERGGDRKDPVILLIMGLGAQSLVWSNVFCKRLIDSGFQVIRFDNRDIGKSSKLKHKNKLTKDNETLRQKLKLISRFKLGLPLPLDDEEVPYNLFDMSEDAHQLLNALEIESCHVLGMSMGGMIAQILAATYPERVLRLGLLSTSNNKPFLPPPSVSALKALMAPIPEDKDPQTIISNNVHLYKTIGSTAYLDENLVYRRAKLLHNRRFYPKGVARQMLAILATGSLVEIDQQIRQPTLIVHGDQDTLLPLAHGKSLSKTIPHSELMLIPGLGHDIPYQLSRYLADVFVAHFNNPIPHKAAVSL